MRVLRVLRLSVIPVLFVAQVYAQIRVPSSGYISTIAGNGSQGYAGDGGIATSAEFHTPERIAVDTSGNVYITDLGNNRVRKITATSGVITTVAGNGTAGFSGDGGSATSAELNDPYGLAVDSAGNLYIGDFGNNRIRKVSANGIITTIAGGATAGYSGDGGAATSAKLSQPAGLAIDGSGNVYFSDHGNNRIREINASTGVISTVAGNGTSGYAGDGGAATSAEISLSYAVTVDPFGNVYISDRGASRIRMVAAATGIITTVAGNGTAGYSGDGGASTAAEINVPSGICTDAAGDVFFADTNNNRIRKITVATGIISTVAGNGTDSFSGDGGVSTSATLGLPQDVTIDQNGNLYIVDFSNYRMRASGAVRITPNVNVSLSNASQTYGSSSPTATVTVPKGIATVMFGSNFGWSSGAISVTNGSASAVVNTTGVQTGNYTVTATYSGNNAYSTGSGSAPLAVSAASSSIAWNTPAAITYGTLLSGTQLNATASVPGTLIYSPASGTELAVGPHALTVAFTPSDTTDYSSSNASVTISVNQATPSISWATPAAITSGTALSNTQLNASANVPGTFSYSPGVGTVLPLGNNTLAVTFIPNDTQDYLNTSASVVLDVVAAATLSISPNTGPPGTTVTITNNNYGSTQGNNILTLNGTTVTPVSWSDQSIVFNIPQSTTAGVALVMISNGGSNVGQQNFVVIPQVTGLGYYQGSTYKSMSVPTAGGFFITGVGFNSIQANSTVTLGGTVLPVSSWSNSSILVQIPQSFPTNLGTQNLVVNVSNTSSVDQIKVNVIAPLQCTYP